LADLQRTVYTHSGHPLAEGRAQDRVSSPAKDRRSANYATQPTQGPQELNPALVMQWTYIYENDFCLGLPLLFRLGLVGLASWLGSVSVYVK